MRCYNGIIIYFKWKMKYSCVCYSIDWSQLFRKLLEITEISSTGRCLHSGQFLYFCLTVFCTINQKDCISYLPIWVKEQSDCIPVWIVWTWSSLICPLNKFAIYLFLNRICDQFCSKKMYMGSYIWDKVKWAISSQIDKWCL